MKALSIRQPWAWAILNAGKRTENREWKYPAKYRGPVLIHAAAGCTRDEYLNAGEGMVDAGLVEYIDERTEMIESRVREGLSIQGRILPRLADLQRGGIVGRANLVDIVKNSFGGHRWAIGSTVALGGRCQLCGVQISTTASTCTKPDPWARPGQLGLILADVEALPFVEMPGALGIFNLSKEQCAAVEAGEKNAGAQ